MHWICLPFCVVCVCYRVDDELCLFARYLYTSRQLVEFGNVGDAYVRSIAEHFANGFGQHCELSARS